MPFTFDELERRAYIEGHTAEAWALGKAMDAEKRCEEAEDLNEELVCDLAEARRGISED
jgi:hypothetical protein